jgi:hypothetical protein
MPHKYQMGQAVLYSGSFARRHVVGGRYVVVRQLPERDGDNQYRIRSEQHPHERVVTEFELQAEQAQSSADEVNHRH